MGARRMRLLLDDGRQPILATQRLAHQFVGVAHAGSDDRPVEVGAGVEQFVEINRLMGAMEIADADMKDARLELASRVSGRGDRELR
jgi:hypothetical protein